MPIDDMNDLFLHELSDVYDAEKQIAEVISEIINEMPPGPARVAFQEHKRETGEQLQNLERCFQILGAQPLPVSCKAVQGLIEARGTFLEEDPTEEIRTMYTLGASAKIEHYELTAYRSLLQMADLLAQPEIAHLLQENLTEEEEMARKVDQLSQEMGREMIEATS